MDSLYDEFGNYIGPDLSDEDSGSASSEPETGGRRSWSDNEDEDVDMQDAAPAAAPAEESDSRMIVEYDEEHAGRIVLHEDKNYFPEAEEVYGDAEIVIGDEDTQPLEQPIIAPVKSKSFMMQEKKIPETTYKLTYLTSMMDKPNFIRNVCLVGHLHHGKTTIMDLFVKSTHPTFKHTRFTDVRHDEQAREISVKSTPMSLVLPMLSGKSYLCNLLDTPGHVNFSDEQTAAMRLCDGAVLVVDAAEGVLLQTERSIRQIVANGLPLILVLSKIDRLILELKLPAKDAYHKLVHTLEAVNTVLAKTGSKQRVSPIKGNVCFASATHNWMFTLQSFAKLYRDKTKTDFNTDHFAGHLWGNTYLQEDGSFGSKPVEQGGLRTFVSFILEPLYKLYAVTIACEGQELLTRLKSVGVRVNKKEMMLDARPLLRLIFGRFFRQSHGFVDMLVEHIPSPVEASARWVEHTYTGDLTSPVALAMKACEEKAPLMLNVTKMYSSNDGTTQNAFGRVMSGKIKIGQKVRVMGSKYTLTNPEDCSVHEVTGLYIYQGRYRVAVNQVKAGNWVLIEGVSDGIQKIATITDSVGNDDCEIFAPLRFNTVSSMKIAIEPINPSDLPKMLNGLRKVNNSYPLCTTKVEDSGEHVILGTGELYLDCVLHDLRKMYGEIEIKVANPIVRFCETVVDSSSMKCSGETPNKQNTIVMTAEPLEPAVSDAIEAGVLHSKMDPVAMKNYLRHEHQWDLLAAKSVWAFGPAQDGPNVLLNDTLPEETDRKLLFNIQDSVTNGFRWGTREGPLCDEPIRQVKFKVIGANIASEPLDRDPRQIIVTSRRVTYSAFLLSTPRLMEPIYRVEVVCPADSVSAAYTVLSRRRGHVTKSTEMPGTPLFKVHAFLPLVESFGFETDLRTHTKGQAFGLSVFDHWDVVPGDPLDRNIVLRPLEPAPTEHLAREFMVKTRRRKGLSEEVSIHKYFDDKMLLELAEQDVDLQSLLEE